jgi:hypothetical protein
MFGSNMAVAFAAGYKIIFVVAVAHVPLSLKHLMIAHYVPGTFAFYHTDPSRK